MKRPFTRQNTKAVFFDMNNTLVDTKASFNSCFVDVLTDFAGRWDDGGDRWNPEDVLKTYHAEWAKRTGKLRGKTKEADSLRKRCLEAALRQYPFQVNDSFAASFFRAMRSQMREHAVLYPHAADTVARLSAHYSVGIITNGGKEQQQRIVEKHGLDAHIPAGRIFATTRSSVRKPNPALFQQAIRALGIRPEEAVMIGDSWTNDVAGALGCGMKAVWLNRAGSSGGSTRRAGNKEVPIVRGIKPITELFEC
ncbi:MAG: phosphatase-like protein [Paenibacillus sp.]|nr:phosphatase-like protein [Paenibacillus sp.]